MAHTPGLLQGSVPVLSRLPDFATIYNSAPWLFDMFILISIGGIIFRLGGERVLGKERKGISGLIGIVIGAIVGIWLNTRKVYLVDTAPLFIMFLVPIVLFGIWHLWTKDFKHKTWRWILFFVFVLFTLNLWAKVNELVVAGGNKTLLTATFASGLFMFTFNLIHELLPWALLFGGIALAVWGGSEILGLAKKKGEEEDKKEPTTKRPTPVRPAVKVAPTTVRPRPIPPARRLKRGGTGPP